MLMYEFCAQKLTILPGSLYDSRYWFLFSVFSKTKVKLPNHLLPQHTDKSMFLIICNDQKLIFLFFMFQP